MKNNILIKCGLVIFVIGAFIVLGFTQWSLFQQQKIIETSIHNIKEQFYSIDKKTLNELNAKLDNQKSSIEESLKRIDTKYENHTTSLQSSFDEMKNVQDESETFFKEKIELVFEEINIIKSQMAKKPKNTYSEKYQKLNEGEKNNIANLIIEFAMCIESKRFEKLKTLFAKDAVCSIEEDIDLKPISKYINHIENKIEKIGKIKLKLRGWSALKLRDSGNYHVGLQLGYSSLGMKHEENGLIDCFMEIKHQGTKLKIDYIEEKISIE